MNITEESCRIIDYQKSPEQILKKLYLLEGYEQEGMSRMVADTVATYDDFRSIIISEGIQYNSTIPLDQVVALAERANLDPKKLLALLAPDNTVNTQLVPDLQTRWAKTPTLGEVKTRDYGFVEQYVMPSLKDPKAVMYLARTLAQTQYEKIKDAPTSADTISIFAKQGDLRGVLRLTAPVTTDTSLINK